MDGTTAPPPTASAWAQDMWTHLTEHAREEGVLLAEYLTAAEETESRALAYVIGLLVDDERRHHRWFADLAASLAAEAELDPAGPVVPRLDFDRANRDAVLDLTRALLARERADAKALDKLRKELRDVEDTTLWAVLVDVMRLDTEKHVTMLRFVEHAAASAPH
jgi:hypothetical protein